MKRVLFLDSVHPTLDEALGAGGYSCEHDHVCTREALLGKIGDYTGLVIRSRLPVDEQLLNAAVRLKWIARSGSGLENIDLAAAKKRDIHVYSSPEGNRDAVAEHATGMLLSLFNGLHRADLQVRMGLWDREGNRGVELSGRTVGIIGYGYMGAAFAERLQGFRCRVMAYDKYKHGFQSPWVEAVSLHTVQQQADVISLHLPLSVETQKFVNEDFIAAMAKPFYLINTARGQHVDTDALVRGLESGKVLGACLDVLEFEKRSLEGLESGVPEALQYLQKSPKVILSPHVAGWTAESYYKLSSVLAQKILNAEGQ